MTRINIPLEQIDPNPYQPRMSEDAEHIQNLAISIGKDGILQPPAARQVGERYQLAFGHSRLAAYKWLVANGYGDDFASMPLELVTLDDEAMYRHAVTENLQRKNLTVIEEAVAMKRAMKDFGYTSAKVGELFGKNESTVRGTVRLLELPDAAREKLASGELTQGQARELLSVKDLLGAEDMHDFVKRAAGSSNFDISYHAYIRLRNEPGVNELYDTNYNDSQYRNRWKPDDVHSFGAPLTEAELPSGLDEQQRAVMLERPACSKCPFMIKVQTSGLCKFEACFKHKSQRFTEHRTSEFVKKMGVSFYQEADGPYRVVDREDMSALKKYSKDLRLISSSLVSGYHYQYWLEGWPGSVLLVAVGLALEVLKDKKREERAKNKAATNLMDYGFGELAWQAAEQLAPLLAGLNQNALLVLHQKIHYTLQPASIYAGKAKPEEEIGADYNSWLRQNLAALILLQGLHLYNAPRPEDAVKILEKRLAELGASSPILPMEAIEKYRLHFESVHGVSVSVETEAELEAA